MSRIDANRIVNVLRQLDRPCTEGQTNESKLRGMHTDPSYLKGKRDPEALRDRLRQRLQKLQTDPVQFAAQAPLVTIREVLMWEFGEAVLNLPGFSHVVTEVTQSIQNHPPTEQALQRLILGLLEK